MSAVRWAVAGAILVLAFIMEPPVWYLISRVSELAGGTGWYRSHLIDEAVNHVAEWWLIGSNHTAHWASDIFNVLPMDPNNIDITNHYIEQGLKGGVLGLALFCAIICALFKRLGTALRGNTSGPATAGQMWAFGVSWQVFRHSSPRRSMSRRLLRTPPGPTSKTLCQPRLGSRLKPKRFSTERI
jgi:hypothetical protein